jgi:hypothetical protein
MNSLDFIMTLFSCPGILLAHPSHQAHAVQMEPEFYAFLDIESKQYLFFP